jgi:Ca2+-binding RTX toxin-like protein
MSTAQLFPIGSFSGGGAEIIAHDPATQRLFLISGGTELQILDINDPLNPTQVGTLDISPYGGGANSVAVRNGIVAIAVEGNENTDPGTVVFLDTNGTFLNAVTVGVLPDMITFSPDGTKVLTANEGEPNDEYTVDPEGSVSIIDLTNGVENATVATAGFTAFNDLQASLEVAGVRIFGPNATVAQDLEPEYITISEDGATAWVTLQENNAIAVVDIATATVTDIVPLGYKDHNAVAPTSLETYQFTDLPTLGTTVGGQDILLGGFSGLFFEGYTAEGNLKFVTHTDRGPNGEPTGSNRPFLLPDFAPEIIRFELDQSTGQLTLTQRIQLQTAPGEPLTGLPNTSIPGGTGNTAYNDEVPVDLFGNTLPLDPLGADLEGIVVAEDGSFWMADEYRPAIYHFDASGVLIDRFVPEGTAAAVGAAAGTFGTEVLPAVLAQRRQNRGFEAIAYQDGKIYAFVQSPLRNPTTTSNGTLNGLQNVRVVEFDPETGETRQFLYTMDNPDLGGTGNSRADKIGDAVAIGNGEFLVVERDDDAIDSDPLSQIEKKVYRFDLGGATDISDLTDPIDLGNGISKTVDQMTAEELASVGIVPIQKTLHVDLATAGYNTVEKVEGLALVDENTIAVINDNDFQVAGITIDPTTGTFTPDPNAEPIVLGLINTAPTNGLDASDRDDAINIQNYPIFGMYQPDGIASFTVNGETYLITANEGDARDYDGFSEEERIKDLDLDPTAFPNADELQEDEVLGRLNVTTTRGDLDGDGDYDQLYAYGGRSFSIWDAQGNLVFDSGDQLEQITATLFPELFNSEGSADGFDSRSDNKGPEPEGVTVGVVNGHTYAFIGLERIGGIMVYDVSNPTAPTFVQYINYNSNSGFAPGADFAPEGLTFIAAEDSPTGNPMLVVANEVSGTTSLFDIAVPTEGTSGRDRIITGDGRDFIVADAGDDLVAGGLGTDVIYGGDGDDTLRGDLNKATAGLNEGDDDIIYGGDGDDRIGGKGGNDKLYGDAGKDQIWGDGGDDLIWGGLGSDRLEGGRGSDTFVLQAGDGNDTIVDFKLNSDKIALAGGLTVDDLAIIAMGANTVLQFEEETLATLRGVRANALIAAADSAFVSI